MTLSKVLITGAKGQLGIELLSQIPEGIEAAGVDLAELDICDSDAVQRYVTSNKPNVVINCAAYTAVDKAEAEPDLAYHVNRNGARNLAEAATRVGARMIQISTDFVFDGNKSSPYLPDDLPNPLSVYGRSKFEGETAVSEATTGDALIVRTAWLYSAHGNNFVKTMLRLMQERPDLRVVADQIGTPTSATTLAKTLWKLILNSAPGGIYHYTDAGVASWYDFAYAIREMATKHSKATLAAVSAIRTVDYPTSAIRPMYSVLDKTKTISVSGPSPHWREPLSDVIVDALLRPRR